MITKVEGYDYLALDIYPVDRSHQFELGKFYAYLCQDGIITAIYFIDKSRSLYMIHLIDEFSSEVSGRLSAVNPLLESPNFYEIKSTNELNLILKDYEVLDKVS